MAKTKKGKKYVEIQGYTYIRKGKRITVPRHDRSTPRPSRGK